MTGRTRINTLEEGVRRDPGVVLAMVPAYIEAQFKQLKESNGGKGLGGKHAGYVEGTICRARLAYNKAAIRMGRPTIGDPEAPAIDRQKMGVRLNLDDVDVVLGRVAMRE
jgi:hypothetical protein